MKLNNVSGEKPTKFQLIKGGVGYNIADDKLFTKDENDNIIEVMRSRALALGHTDGSQQYYKAFLGSTPATYGAVTGLIQIIIPRKITEIFSMFSFKVRIYNFVTGGTAELLIGGYTFTGAGVSSWHSTSVRLFGDNVIIPANKVYFSKTTDGYMSILIGNTTDTWSYPQITCYDLIAGYRGGKVLAEAGEWDVKITPTPNWIDLGVSHALTPKKHPLTLLNGWVNYSTAFEGAGYVIQDGICHIYGLIKSGTAVSTIATLPVGVRPNASHIMIVMTDVGPERLDIQNTGLIYYQGSSNGYLSLACSFPVAE